MNRLLRLARSIATLIVITLGLFPHSAGAVLRVDITQGNIDPLPLALPAFEGTANTQTRRIGADIAKVIAADLERSGLFRMINPKAFIDKTSAFRVRPRFADWRVINAQALVSGRTERLRDGRLRVEFRLWDVFAEQQMIGMRYHTTPDNWRRIGHIIADEIYHRLTGERGYFDSRIVYVAESGPHDKRTYRLAIMDQDGENHRFLTDGKHIVLTPRFSPTRQEITYLSYFADKPRVYIYNIDSGKQEMLGDFPGMTFAPRFSPDGNKVIMSLARDGNSDIYVMDLPTRRTKRLTSNPAIDTSPGYSPDGKHIVFNSDRGGRQQLYVMDADGANVRRITFGKGRYATPVWSPRGDLIAFTKMYQNKFYIGVMRPDGTGERLLTDSFHNEGPTWAPNGRVLMFYRQTRQTSAKQGGTSHIWSIDLTGYNEREVWTPMEASDPAWSPLIR